VAEETTIEWTDHTWNPWSGCVKVSPGCKFCYADAAPPSWRRFAVWGEWQPRILASDSYWKEPERWNRRAERNQVRERVFCASMADVFEDRDDLDPWRERLWELIKATPWLDWLLLTKRPEKMARWSKAHGWPWNAWAGTSVESQDQEERIHHLLEVADTQPGVVRFLSLEPLLGPIRGIEKYLSKSDLGFCRCILCKGTGLKNRAGQLGSGQPGDPPCSDCHRGYVGGVGWVIAGGESGSNARPMHPDWIRWIRDEVTTSEVPFLFKQWGELAPWVNEAHFTHSGEEKHAHLWIDRETGETGACWIVDDDGLWSNWTGDPRRRPRVGPDAEGLHEAVAILGRHGKKVSGRVLDGRTWTEFPRPA
jgi:protein gp37